MVDDRENVGQEIESGQDGNVAEAKPLTLAAKRALAEAEQRRLSAEAEAAAPREVAGRNGPEPVRYGDWEVKGLATDF